ncbi:GGDEF domain-containing protein [Cohnella endophytica]|uniref:GGDEF domain-containing protein n=1 Tax=Cohnella endophytica TaxID=2419778 RepID=A0A494XYF2_9BACL|nr:GGDEF domain-containing protein [Cohnella endophytica]RKP54989.1 GGDEF domain-containing protein [Cohnella endophytica]
MNEAYGWLDPNLATRLKSLAIDPQRCGLFIVRWEGGQAFAELNETGSVKASLRIARLMRLVAYRFAKVSDSVIGWTLYEANLIIMVSLEAVEAQPGDEGEAGEVAAGRMAFLLRDLAGRAFMDYPLSRTLEAGSSFRCGFGRLTASEQRKSENKSESSRSSARTWEEALLFAYEEAWKRMFFANSPMLRFPLTEHGAVPVQTEIKVRYKPIISLLDGSLYGYEAIPVEPDRGGASIDLKTFYANAEQTGNLFECDRRFREAAIRGFPSRHGDVKLFLPVPAKIIFDPRLYPGSTLRRIEAANLRPEHVVLVLIGGEDEPSATIKAALGHYRNQGFRIALSDRIPDLASLRRMKEMHPDYARMDVRWIGDAGIDSVEESLLKALMSLSRKEQIVLIADGLDREGQLPALVASGMNYAQGDWIGGGHEEAAGSSQRVQSTIRSQVNMRYKGASGTVSELAMPVKLFGRDTPVSEISRHFELHKEAQGLVISDDGKPIGLLMKEKLHQLLSGQFGLPLYWNRAVGKIMDSYPMIVDESIPVDQASQMAMGREPDKLYDAVIITRGGAVLGIASIQSMLEWVTQTRMADAQWANPLSGLPGNEPIRRELIRRLSEGKEFAVLYADLDHFKWYNDQYGFHKGDDVIRFTGETLLETVKLRASADCFVGHIGGDDFIVIASGTDVEAMSQDIIGRFKRGIGAYTGNHEGPVLDRKGMPVNEASGLSMSLSLLLCQSTEGWTPESLSEKAASLKKKAKLIPGDSLVQERITDHSRDLTAY